MAERRYRSGRNQDDSRRPPSRPDTQVHRTSHSPSPAPPPSQRQRNVPNSPGKRATHAHADRPRQGSARPQTAIYGQRPSRDPQRQQDSQSRRTVRERQRYQNGKRSQRQQSHRSPNARPPRNRFLLVVPVLVVIALACIVWFFACSNDDANTGQDPSTTTSTAQQAADASMSASPSHPAATMLTGNAQDRAATSESANDVKPSEKVVYLTFDDGPSEHTQQILDTLDAYGIKATWFILGNTGHIDTVKEIWERGHQVGLHSSEHDYDYIYADPANFVADIEKVGSAVSERIGFMPTLIRFPGGSANGYNAGRADAFRQAAAEHGWHYFDWNVSIGDSTQPPASVETLVGNIEREAEGCNSCNVLMHDSYFKPTTPDALPQIIEHFIDEGYSFDVIGADSFGYHF